ncbi:MAG: peptidoglycan DD-metalloendopeptidase family protein [Bacteroidales bacterium]|nr:peptidoglycan DD-metalloendopeptidase family protein [Bacteroidales bacterium]
MMDYRFIPLVMCVCMAMAPLTPDVNAVTPPAREQSRATSAKKSSATAKKGSSTGKKAAAGKTTTPAKKKSSASKGGNSKSGNKNASQKRRSKRGGAAAAAVTGSAAEMQRQQEEAQREITATKKRLKETDGNIKKGVAELGRLQGDIGDARKKVEMAASEVSALDSKINGLESQVNSEEKQLDKLRTEYLKAIKKMRVAGKNNSTLAFIFSSGSFHQALRRMRYLKEFSEWKERQSAEISKTVERLRQQRDLLAQSRLEKDAALRRQQSAHRELQNQYARQDALVVELRANREALNTHLAQKQAEANTLKSRISALIAAEEQARRQREEEERRRREEAAAAERRQREEKDRQAELAKAERIEKEKAQAELAAASKRDNKSDNKKDKDFRKKESAGKDAAKKTDSRNLAGKTTSHKEKSKDYADARKRKPRSGDAAGSSSAGKNSNYDKSAAVASSAGGAFENMRGSLPRPVTGSFRITSPFGRHSLPELPDVMYDNPGIDAQVAAGATAQAVFGGKVSGVYMIPGFSTVVIVSHGNYYTVYGNIASPSVKVGDSVKQGQSVGRLAVDEDDPGHSSIHFEVWRNREKLNPADWIR